MIKVISIEIRAILDSFKANANGYSGRKLSSFFAVIMAAYVTIYKLPAEGEIRLHALYAWLLFALLCLGIVTVQQVIEFKNGRQTPKDDKPS